MNRVVVEDSDNEGLKDDTSIPTSHRDAVAHPPSQHRPTRKSKEQAGKAWEALVPGKKRTQRQVQAASDSDTADVVRSARKKHRSGKGPVKASQGATPLTAAMYPAPEVPASDDDEPMDTMRASKSHHKQRRVGSEDTTGSVSSTHLSKHSRAGSEVQRVTYMKRTLTVSEDHDTFLTDANGDHDGAESAEADEDEEYDAEGEYQQANAADEEEEDKDEDEDEEVEEDEDPDQDDYALARQLEAERATWTNSDGEASNDEFPDVSTLIKDSHVPTKHHGGSAARPTKRIRSGSLSSGNDKHRSDSDESLHLAPVSRRRTKRSREDSFEGSNDPDLADLPDRNIHKKARQVEKMKAASTPRSSSKQSSLTPGRKALKSSGHANARTPSKALAGSVPYSKATDRNRPPERHASGTKPRHPKARQQETVEWLDEDDDNPSPVKLRRLPGARNDHATLKSKGPMKARKGSDQTTNESVHSEGGVDAEQSESDSNIDSGIELVDPGPKLALTNQRPRVKGVALQAIEDVLIDVCLQNAFPEGPDKHNHFTRPTLIRVAKSLKCSDIAQRLKTDSTYSRYLGSIPAQRISTFRGKIKKHTDSVVATTYGLNPGDGAKVDWLDHKLTYIYPHEYKTRKVERHLPYSLSIFAQVMRAMWFSRPTSYGFKVLPKFCSSSLQFPREKEIPAPMLALVSTAIYASILDYSAPTYKAGDFTGNEFSDVYARNIRALQSIRDADVEKYHVLMHGFFKMLCGSHGSSLSGSKYADDLDALDIAGMPGA